MTAMIASIADCTWFRRYNHTITDPLAYVDIGCTCLGLATKVWKLVVWRLYLIDFACFGLKSTLEIISKWRSLWKRNVFEKRGALQRSVNGLGKWKAQNSWLANFIQKSLLPLIGTEKRSRKPESGIKDSSEESEHKFPFGTFRPEKEDYLVRCSVAPGNFPLERPEFTSQQEFQETFGKWKAHTFSKAESCKNGVPVFQPHPQGRALGTRLREFYFITTHARLSF